MPRTSRLRRRLLTFVALSSLIAIVALVSTSTIGQRELITDFEEVDLHPTYTVLQNVTYCSVGSQNLLADIYYPLHRSAGMPFVLFVHGGGWQFNTKRHILEDPEKSTLHALTTHGYVVAAIDYRLAPQHQFPVMIEDVKCAVRSFRAQAQRFQIDPRRMAAWGTSAGGHLVDLLGVADRSIGWDVGQYLGQSSRVQAVVAWFAPTDLGALPDAAKQQQALQAAFGTTNPKVLARDSPISYVDADDPPFLIVQGKEDQTVPPSQSERFAAVLRAADVYTDLQLVDHSGHGFAPSPPNASIDPSLDQINNLVVSFLDRELPATTSH